MNGKGQEEKSLSVSEEGWRAVSAIVGRYCAEWRDWEPKDSYSEMIPAAALLGNGDVGVVSAGSRTEKGYLISKSDFWSAGDLRGVFGGKEENKTKPLPIGGVSVRPCGVDSPADKSAVASFYEKLDILDGGLETKLEGTELSLKTHVVAGKNIMLTELLSPRPLEVDVVVWSKADNAAFPGVVGVEKGRQYASRKTYNGASDNEKSWTSEAVIASKVIGGSSASPVKNADGSTSCRVSLQPNRPAWIVTAIGGGGRIYDHKGKLTGREPLAEALSLLNWVGDVDDVRRLYKEHCDWWKGYWSASHIDLDKSDESLARLERYYYGSQYLFASTTRAGKLAPGLYGVWHTTDMPAWSSDYHMNYNFIAAFYGAASSNRCAFLLPAVEAMLNFEQEGTARAADPGQLKRINSEYVESRPELQKGIKDAVLYPVGIGPWGTFADDSYHNEVMNASYSSYPIVQYYDYTRDRAFLKRVYGFMKKCAAFYETWLEKSGAGYVLYAGYNEGSWSKNPAVELAALKNVLSFLIRTGPEAGESPGRIARWQEMYDKLPVQPVSSWKGKEVFALAEKEKRDGQWRDLESPIHVGGNVVPLDVILPGGQLGYYSSAPKLEIARNTIEAFGDGVWGQMNNFPRIFYDAVQVRYPAKEILRRMEDAVKNQMRSNFTVWDGYHGVEKIGTTAAINGMLVLSHGGIVKVFPNWPEDRDARFSRLRVDGGFLISSEYNAKVKKIACVRVESTAGGPIVLGLPWDGGAVVRNGRGEEIPVKTGNSGGDWKEETLSFRTTAGECYEILPRN